MKNFLKTAVVGVAATSFVASVAVAGTDRDGEPQRPTFRQGRQIGPGGPGFRGPGRGGPFGGVFADLTEQQREQVKAILDAEREAAGGPREEMKLRQALNLELLADAPNAQKIEELKQQIVSGHAESQSRHIAVQQKINQVLTAEQRAKARERITQRAIR